MTRTSRRSGVRSGFSRAHAQRPPRARARRSPCSPPRRMWVDAKRPKPLRPGCGAAACDAPGALRRMSHGGYVGFAYRLTAKGTLMAKAPTQDAVAAPQAPDAFDLGAGRPALLPGSPIPDGAA